MFKFFCRRVEYNEWYTTNNRAISRNIDIDCSGFYSSAKVFALRKLLPTKLFYISCTHHCKKKLERRVVLYFVIIRAFLSESEFAEFENWQDKTSRIVYINSENSKIMKILIQTEKGKKARFVAASISLINKKSANLNWFF